MEGACFNSERGFTLLGVLMVLVVLSVLGVGIIATSANVMKVSTEERKDQSVFYIAEAGVVKGIHEIETVVNQVFNDVNDEFKGLSSLEKKVFNFENRFYKELDMRIPTTLTPPSFETSLGETPSASVTVTSISINPRIYKIKSVGVIGNKTRTVVQEFTISLNPSEIEKPGIPGNRALQVSKKIDMGGSVKVEGDAGIESRDSNDVKFSGTARVTGKLFHGVKNNISLPSFPIYPTYNIPRDQKIKNSNGNETDLVKDGKILIGNYITNGYTLNMSGNMEFKEIFVNENNTFIINLGTADKEIVVDHLNVINGHIKIVGSGKLTIYVKDKITLGSSSTINAKYNGLNDHQQAGDINKLKVYQKGSNPINLAGGQKIYGSLHAESANINITNGGGFQGDIFTGGKEIYVGGGTSVNTQVFLAPNAKFTLGEGGHIKGSVIADSFIATGGGSLTYAVTNPGNGIGGSETSYGNGENIITKKSLIEE
jgi:type II secretory pathway pseudopilin PulG